MDIAPSSAPRPTHPVAALMAQSGFFDPTYYADKYGLQDLTAEQLAEHYRTNYATCPEPSGLFSGLDYYGFNSDVAKTGINPLEHFLLYGIAQSRRAISDEKCVEFFSNSRPEDTVTLTDVVPRGVKIRVLYTTIGNFFFQDIAEYVARALQELGWAAELMSDRDAREAEPGWFDLVVAPHEYMVIGAGYLWSEARWKDAAYFNTEQWQTPWFAACFKYMQGSRRGVIDLNPTSAAAFARINVRAAFLPLLPLDKTAFQQKRATFSRSFARRKFVETLAYPGDITDRQYDLVFVANLNRRRQEILAQMAPDLAAFKTFLHAPVMDKPVRPGDGDMLSGRDFTQLAKNSKILLNIHRDEIGYFEWHRLFLYGVANATVVVTEPCFHVPLLEPGVHYIEAEVEEMPDLLRMLLTTVEGAERLRTISAACKAICAQATLADLVQTS